MTIKTNNHWRPFLYRYEVPEKILASEFDWQNDPDDVEVDSFLQYKGVYYHIREFLHADSPAFEGWDGEMWWSATSGILIKLSDDGEYYKIATFY